MIISYIYVCSQVQIYIKGVQHWKLMREVCTNLDKLPVSYFYVIHIAHFGSGAQLGPSDGGGSRERSECVDPGNRVQVPGYPYFFFKSLLTLF